MDIVSEENKIYLCIQTIQNLSNESLTVPKT